MKRRSISIPLCIVLALLLGELSQADNPEFAARMDVFITADQPITRLEPFVAKHPEIALRIHTLDAIENLENELSKGLPGDPSEAKRLALTRLKQLSKDKRAQLEHAATSIATALRYGVMKYPAIVFDNDFVVYGLSDPFRALEHYRRWRLAETS